MTYFSSSQRHTGFTLIETLVAIFIFSTALIALSGVASRGVSSVNRAKEVTTAQFLAQEALELVRATRDDVTLANATPWDIGWRPEGGVDCINNACDITYQSGVPQLRECGSVCGELSIQNGIYTSDPYTASNANTTQLTNFSRTIKVVPVDTTVGGSPAASWRTQYAVYATISWPVGSGTRSVQAVSLLSDWQTPGVE